MSETNFMAIHSVLVETFCSKPQMSTSWCSWKKSQRITKVSKIHAQGTMNDWTKFCGMMIIEMFQSWPKWRSDWPTNRHPQIYSPSISIKKKTGKVIFAREITESNLPTSILLVAVWSLLNYNRLWCLIHVDCAKCKCLNLKDLKLVI